MLHNPHDTPGFQVPLHRSLTEAILIAGAPRSVAIIIWIAGHAVAVWVTRADPAFLVVLSRHARHKGALAC